MIVGMGVEVVVDSAVSVGVVVGKGVEVGAGVSVGEGGAVSVIVGEGCAVVSVSVDESGRVLVGIRVSDAYGVRVGSQVGGGWDGWLPRQEQRHKPRRAIVAHWIKDRLTDRILTSIVTKLIFAGDSTQVEL